MTDGAVPQAAGRRVVLWCMMRCREPVELTGKRPRPVHAATGEAKGPGHGATGVPVHAMTGHELQVKLQAVSRRVIG